MQLDVDSFDSVINEDKYSFILFTVENCPPCQFMKETLAKIASEFASVSFYTIDKNQLSHEQRTRHLIGYPPRSVIYKGGQQVGRLFLAQGPERIRAALYEIESTGKFLATEDDAEEVTRFYAKVMEAMEIDWKQYKGEARQAKANEIMNLAHRIIDSTRAWSLLTNTEIKMEATHVNPTNG